MPPINLQVLCRIVPFEHLHSPAPPDPQRARVDRTCEKRPTQLTYPHVLCKLVRGRDGSRLPYPWNWTLPAGGERTAEPGVVNPYTHKRGNVQ